jgi:hypothetical protein
MNAGTGGRMYTRRSRSFSCVGRRSSFVKIVDDETCEDMS